MQENGLLKSLGKILVAVMAILSAIYFVDYFMDRSRSYSLLSAIGFGLMALGVYRNNGCELTGNGWSGFFEKIFIIIGAVLVIASFAIKWFA